MDQRTADHYDHAAAGIAERHRAVALDTWRQQFTEAFPAGCRVLDVGVGSGRDLALLLSLGYDAHGCEPSAGMREQAAKAYPQLAARLQAHALPFTGPHRTRAQPRRQGCHLKARPLSGAQ